MSLKFIVVFYRYIEWLHVMKTLYVTVEQDSSIGLTHLKDAISYTPKDPFVRSENQLPLQQGVCYLFSK